MNAITHFNCYTKETCDDFPVLRIFAEVAICKNAPIVEVDTQTLKRQICDAVELAVTLQKKENHERKANG